MTVSDETESVITLEIGPGGGNGEGLVLDSWKSYTFNSNFLTPTDGWSFTLGDDVITDEVRIAIAPRQKVTLSIGGNIQCTGFVDKVSANSTRGGGLELTIEGRDVLSPAVDSVIDPRKKFTPEMSLLTLLQNVFAPFGFTEKDQFLLDNEDNRNVMTGRQHKTTKAGGIHNTPVKNAKVASKKGGKGKKKKAKALDSYQLHLLKPDLHETAFTFAARVSQRFGLWIWAHADGKHLIIGEPTFDDGPDCIVTHKRPDKADHTFATEGLANNIISSHVTRDAASQPSIIFGSASSTGGANPRDQFSVGIVNPSVQTFLTDILAAYSKTRLIDLEYLGVGYKSEWVENPDGGPKTYEVRSPIEAYVDSSARPLFLTDQNSKSQEELECFLKRELALRRQKAFTYSFEVVGHEYEDRDGAKVPWQVDMIVRVDDDYCDVHEDLWVIGRTFTKSRGGGTMTKIECVRQHTLEF